MNLNINNNEDTNTNTNTNSNTNYRVLNFYWGPINSITQNIEFFCVQNKFQHILEIGPGIVPFSLSTKTIGFNEKIKDYIQLDIDTNRLPFEDGDMDFVYSRHTLEDIQNPDFCMNEIIRISKSGYIETPSPLIEVTKGVDAPDKSINYAGYIHHRYIIWSNIEKCEIYFLPKYNSIIDNYFEPNSDNRMKYYDIINNNPIYWNNYFIWKDKTPKVIMYKNGVNFGVKNHMITDYIYLLYEAINTSIQNTDYFIINYNKTNL
jgi:hypothetical protein